MDEVHGMLIISHYSSFLKNSLFFFFKHSRPTKASVPLLCRFLVNFLPHSWRKKGEKSHIEHVYKKRAKSPMNIFLFQEEVMLHFKFRDLCCVPHGAPTKTSCSLMCSVVLPSVCILKCALNSSRPPEGSRGKRFYRGFGITNNLEKAFAKMYLPWLCCTCIFFICSVFTSFIKSLS